MSDQAIYKEKLLAEQKNLFHELSELGFQDASVPEDWVATPDDPAKANPDENVVADRKEEWMERRGEVAALETRYNNINRALVKLETGSFGQCEICDQPIASERLMANPAARTCQEHLEDEDKLTG